jgi:hypothetical protein
MRTHFTEVLARERACLTEVSTGGMLAGWRRRIVEELMTPRSPYFLALQRSRDVPERAEFLDQWRELIAETLDRLLQSSTMRDTPCPLRRAPGIDVDAQRTAVLILAALHGGSTLSRIAEDARPLDAALDLALVPFAATGDNSPSRTGNKLPS